MSGLAWNKSRTDQGGEMQEEKGVIITRPWRWRWKWEMRRRRNKWWFVWIPVWSFHSLISLGCTVYIEVDGMISVIVTMTITIIIIIFIIIFSSSCQLVRCRYQVTHPSYDMQWHAQPVRHASQGWRWGEEIQNSRSIAVCLMYVYSTWSQLSPPHLLLSLGSQQERK